MCIHRQFEDKSNEELLVEYSKTKDNRLKQEIVMRYIYLVKNIAMRFRGVYASAAQIEDIINEGVVALMKAVDKYDPNMNIKFETFVSKRLKGMIIDVARKNDWVPRNIRKEMKEIDKAGKALYESLGRFPSDQEMADYLKISLDKYLKIVERTNIHNLISLDYYLTERTSDPSDEGLISMEMLPEQQIEKQEVSKVLKEGLMSLKENEQKVLSLYYRKELTMREISEVMHLSKPRISQIHANALRKLRLYLEKNDTMEGIKNVSGIL